MRSPLVLLTVALVGAGGCRTEPEAVPMRGEEEAQAPREAFWSHLTALCGEAYEGVVAEDSSADPAFQDRRLVMHVRECRDDEVRIPLHVGEDRSRTWIVTRTATGLRLKHDHRHEDGTEDEITQYGGDTREPGTPSTQEFHADEFTAQLVPVAATNIWTMEVVPGEHFAYGLRREGTNRRIRFEFDLTRPVQPPPAPWGHE